jgi:hypothetical protein
MMDETKETRNLPVILSEAELKVKASEFAREFRALDLMKEELKGITARKNNEIKHKALKVSVLSTVVDTGIEHREVECVQRQDREKLIIEIIRCDTGEVIQTRPMTANERQLIMFPKAKLSIVGEEVKKSESEVLEKTGTDGSQVVAEMTQAPAAPVNIPDMPPVNAEAIVDPSIPGDTHDQVEKEKGKKGKKS